MPAVEMNELDAEALDQARAWLVAIGQHRLVVNIDALTTRYKNAIVEVGRRSAAQTDERALIAEARRHDEAFDNPASTVEYGRAQNWLRTNLAALLTGYSAALDEIDRLRTGIAAIAHDCDADDCDCGPRLRELSSPDWQSKVWERIRGG